MVCLLWGHPISFELILCVTNIPGVVATAIPDIQLPSNWLSSTNSEWFSQQLSLISKLRAIWFMWTPKFTTRWWSRALKPQYIFFWVLFLQYQIKHYINGSIKKKKKKIFFLKITGIFFVFGWCWNYRETMKKVWVNYWKKLITLWILTKEHI